jgi:hypothetical protein
VRRNGALQLQKSLVAFPDTEEFRTAAARVRTAVREVGGSVVAVGAEPLDGEDGAALLTAWNEARADEYAELTAECEKLVAEIEKEFNKQKFTLAELDEEEAELEKLRAWHERIRARDVHDCEGSNQAGAALDRAAEAVTRFSTAVFERSHG